LGRTLHVFLAKPALLAGAIAISGAPTGKLHHDLVIDALTTDQKWHRISDTAQDRAQLVRDIAADMKQNDEPEEDLQDLYFICAFLLGDFAGAQRIYDSNAKRIAQA
jgi:predicted proteasome-type protease